MSDRGPAPFGRRLCEVVENRASGGYRLFSLLDGEGPAPQPGQFYMLAAERDWGASGGRPYLPRAFSVAMAEAAEGGVRLDFLGEAVGPGTERLCGLRAGERAWVNGPLGRPFSTPRQASPEAAGAILVGGGIGVAPLALLRRELSAAGVPVRALLGFRDRAHSGGLDDLFPCSEVRLASEDGHAGHRGYVTDLLGVLLEGDDVGGAVVYSCGPPPMLEAVREMCTTRGVACELAMEAPMACGFGACFGCAIPLREGGYMRLCVDGPVVNAAKITAATHPGTDRQAAGPVAQSPPLAYRPVSDSAHHPRIDVRSPAATPVPGGGADLGDHPEQRPQRRGGGTKSATGPAGPALCGIELHNPVINGSGTFDAIAARQVFGDELLEDFPFAAFVSKTITPEPRDGNPPPRLWEAPAGLVNSIGLPNKGLDGFLAQDLPQLAELPVPLIVSVMGTSPEEFERLVSAVSEREQVAALELNVSCPNVHSGLIVGEQPAEAEALLERLRPLTSKPLVAKLTPNVSDPASVAAAVERGGGDAVSLINTLKAAPVDPATGRPWLGAGRGGLSGAAVRSIALEQTRSVAAAIRLPVIGMGGIECGAHAREFISAGASLVATGTENFRDPRAGQRVARELADLDLRSRSR